jgi:lipoyl(octanoyl) transferase
MMPDPKSPEPVNGAFTEPAPAQVTWKISPGLVDYHDAIAAMEARVEAIANGEAGELVWLLEHPPVYTLGTSGKDEDVLSAGATPVIKTGRGGQVTWHGPGQRVVYVMLDLRHRGRDVREFVQRLERWLIAALGRFNVKGEMRCGRVGVWVDRSTPGHFQEDKIAAIGVRLRRWVSFHGIALNVEPDLAAFQQIIPCGIDEAGLGVTSLVDLGLPVTMDDVDDALRAAFIEVFGGVLAEE